MFPRKLKNPRVSRAVKRPNPGNPIVARFVNNRGEDLEHSPCPSPQPRPPEKHLETTKIPQKTRMDAPGSGFFEVDTIPNMESFRRGHHNIPKRGVTPLRINHSPRAKRRQEEINWSDDESPLRPMKQNTIHIPTVRKFVPPVDRFPPFAQVPSRSKVRKPRVDPSDPRSRSKPSEADQPHAIAPENPASIDTQVLLEESDMEKQTSDDDDDIEQCSPLKDQPKSLLRVKPSFLDDIDHIDGLGYSLKQSKMSPRVPADENLTAEQFLGRILPSHEKPPMENMIRMQDIMRMVRRPSPLPEGEVIQAREFRGHLSPPPAPTFNDVPDSGGKKIKAMKNGLAASLEDALNKERTSITLWRNKDDRGGKTVLIEVLSVTEEYAFARCECRRLETSEDVHQQYETCVVYFGQDQLKKLKFGIGMKIRIHRPWQEMEMREQKVLVILAAFALEVVSEAQAEIIASNHSPCRDTSSMLPLPHPLTQNTTQRHLKPRALFEPDGAHSGRLNQSRIFSLVPGQLSSVNLRVIVQRVVKIFKGEPTISGTLQPSLSRPPPAQTERFSLLIQDEEGTLSELMVKTSCPAWESWNAVVDEGEGRVFEMSHMRVLKRATPLVTGSLSSYLEKPLAQSPVVLALDEDSTFSELTDEHLFHYLEPRRLDVATSLSAFQTQCRYSISGVLLSMVAIDGHTSLLYLVDESSCDNYICIEAGAVVCRALDQIGQLLHFKDLRTTSEARRFTMDPYSQLQATQEFQTELLASFKFLEFNPSSIDLGHLCRIKGKISEVDVSAVFVTFYCLACGENSLCDTDEMTSTQTPLRLCTGCGMKTPKPGIRANVPVLLTDGNLRLRVRLALDTITKHIGPEQIYRQNARTEHLEGSDIDIVTRFVARQDNCLLFDELSLSL